MAKYWNIFNCETKIKKIRQDTVFLKKLWQVIKAGLPSFSLLSPVMTVIGSKQNPGTADVGNIIQMKTTPKYLYTFSISSTTFGLNCSV